MGIIDYIPVGHNNAVSREYLSRVTGMNDRAVRAAIHEARRDTVILNVGGGYYRPDPNDTEDRHEVLRYTRQETARLKSIGWALKAAWKLAKEIEEQA